MTGTQTYGLALGMRTQQRVRWESIIINQTWGSGPLLCMAWYLSLQGTGFNLSKYRWCYEFGGVSHCFVQQGYLCAQVACIHRFIIHRIIPLKNSRKPKRDPYIY